MEGNGHPPVEKIHIKHQTIYQPESTLAEKGPDGRIQVNFIVEIGGQHVMHSYMVGDNGQQQIQAAMSGIHLAGPGDMPNA